MKFIKVTTPYPIQHVNLRAWVTVVIATQRLKRKRGHARLSSRRLSVRYCASLKYSSVRRINVNVDLLHHCGWYLASLIERFEIDGEDPQNSRRRCLANETWHLIRANSPQEAYSKGVRIGTLSRNNVYKDARGRSGHYVFVGLRELMPVFEDIQDGAEILWLEYPHSQVAVVNGMVQSESDLVSRAQALLLPEQQTTPRHEQKMGKAHQRGSAPP